ncbi:MAG: cell division protein FtsQ [Paraglaciecola sp.]|jgi:cell division protein FtsQ
MSELPTSVEESTESVPEPIRDFHFLGGMVFLALLLAALVYGAVQLSIWLEDEQQAPVQKIVVSGQRQFVDDRKIEALIRKSQPGSFFNLDVEKAHQDVEALAWVYRASVRKRWPNGLEIYVVEQVPAAKWNDDLLLNQFGDVFQALMDEGEIDLPSLFGPGGSEQTALQGYLAMRSLLIGADFEISELFLSERFAWNVRLSNGIKLNLGRTEFIDRLQRFIDLYPLLNKQDKAVDYVDLRYDTGLAVGWKTELIEQQKES